MSLRYHLSAELQYRTIKRLEASQSQTEMARWLNVSLALTTISSHWCSLQKVLPRTGKSYNIYLMTDVLQLCVWRNRRATTFHLIASLAAFTGGLVSMSIVHKRLHEGGLYMRRPAICVLLISHYQRKLLRWACQHVHMTADQLMNVLVTDESQFNLHNNSRQLIWIE